MRAVPSAAFVVAGIAAPALAHDAPPPRKPGLWTITAVAAGEPDQVTRFCTDEATDAGMPHLDAADGQGPCSEENRQHEGDTIVYDTTCRVAGLETKSHVVTTTSGGQVERLKSTYVFNPPVHGLREGSSTMQWVGACPPDMQPGDVETPQGMKVNIVSGKISAFGGKPSR